MVLSLTVGLQKGGTAKSTTAVYLAIKAARETGQKVLLVDADPRSQSAYTWSGFAGDDWPKGVVVIPWPTTDLDKRVSAVAGDYPGGVIIDTGGDNPEILESALKVTKDLLMPLAPNAAEFTRAAATVSVARAIARLHNPDLAYQMLFVRVGSRRDADVRALRAYFDEKEIPYAATRIPHRKEYSRAFGTGVPDLGEYNDLYSELMED